MSEEGLKLTLKVLEINPEFYTVVIHIDAIMSTMFYFLVFRRAISI